MKHSHWTIWGYDKERKNKAGEMVFDDIVKISVDANTETEALKKAKETIKRKGYRISEVIRCETDHKLYEELQLEAVATQKLMLKELLGHKEG